IPAGGNSFVIQEHHASRMHWDLRLEHEGVLVSWALPKGVPESGGKNHLAVQTEDHPMDYLTFHGTIPKGQYGAGEMTIWDTGTYELHKWINGKEVIVTLAGSEGGGLGGARKVALIHTGRGQGKDAESQWLIHLMDKEQAGGRRRAAPAEREGGDGGPAPARDAAPEVPEPPAVTTPVDAMEFRPMMATSGDEADLQGSAWQYELKWDGVRAVLVGDGKQVRIFSRNGNDVTRTYPEFTDPACWPGEPFVADGEIVAVGPGGRPDFGLLQGRMKLTRAADVAKARVAIPVQLMLFDLLFSGGKDLRRLPLSKRRERLEEFFEPSGCPMQLSPVLDEPVRHLLDSAQELGLEGIMAKRRDSRYVSGQRTRTWLKLKTEQTQEVVVGGWRPGKGGRADTVGSLLVGIPDGDKLQYVGRVGSGFSTRELEELRQTVERLGRKTSPFHDVPRPDAADAHWVAPELVGEVTYGEWTGPGRLRHPRWRGWRLDKDPSEVVREG
ncbi:MAG: ATP-dependent DNA ligase, partial [Pseudarthrobacter sp.]|nr:ATP-dependent DNA ligase [Pseudarthrobacter sp.]